MEAPSRQPARRTLTPAVLLAAAFTVTSAAISIAFVAGNGGLAVPGLAAAASTAPAPSSSEAAPSEPVPTSPIPTTVASPGRAVPSIQPTVAPSVPGATATPNLMTLLPQCPGFLACWEYTVRRGDTLSEIGSRYLVPLDLIKWLNPQITDPSTIVLGQIVFLGLDGYARLPACSDQAGCYLYVVRAGDRLSTIAGHLGITTQAIVDFDPRVTDANAIYTGETIRVPGPTR